MSHRGVAPVPARNSWQQLAIVRVGNKVLPPADAAPTRFLKKAIDEWRRRTRKAARAIFWGLPLPATPAIRRPPVRPAATSQPRAVAFKRRRSMQGELHQAGHREPTDHYEVTVDDVAGASHPAARACWLGLLAGLCLLAGCRRPVQYSVNVNVVVAVRGIR